MNLQNKRVNCTRTHNGQEIVPDGTRVRVVTQPDGAVALLIAEAKAPDAGQYGVIAANDKGESSCSAELSVASEFARFNKILRQFYATH